MKLAMIAAALGVSGLYAVLGFADRWDDEWRIKPANDAGKVMFSIERLRPGSHWSMSTDMPIDQFRGLTMETVEQGGKVKFEFVRDAGRLACQGYIKHGYGIGEFEFIANTAYISELQRLGYEAPETRELFNMTMSDVSLAFAKGVKAAHVPATTKELIEMRTHGIDLDYVDRMRASGYTTFRPGISWR